MPSHFSHTRGGFSILMAMGTIAVLLILVTSLSVNYIRESKLAQLAYDDVVSGYAAQGMFEYAMLKIRNHRDGFEDAITDADSEKDILKPKSGRSAGLIAGYSISASSTGHVFNVPSGEHLIIPLFSATGELIPNSIFAKTPLWGTGVQKVSNLTIGGIGTLDWSLIAMSGSESIALSGTGNITSITEGRIRLKQSQCYRGSDAVIIDCKNINLGQNDEEIVYSYEIPQRIQDFLYEKNDSYFVLYNPSPVTLEVSINTDVPFGLPLLQVRATAHRGRSSQVFDFIEDKGKYYDALKYGIYNE